MKKTPDQQNNENNDMLPEYNFSAGVRGKHHKAYRAGHSVQITREDGTVCEQHFTLEEGAVMLDPDVREYYTDSESVNNALRTLISLIPKKKPQSKAS